jgi:DNA invertase Pin-like site-specific DNA recombinase
MVTLVGLFAEIERELIALRIKEALAPARAAVKRLGRPRGPLGRSKLDGRASEIRQLLALEVSKASIAKSRGSIMRPCTTASPPKSWGRSSDPLGRGGAP